MSERRNLENNRRLRGGWRTACGTGGLALVLAACAPSGVNRTTETTSAAPAPTEATGPTATPASPAPSFEAGQYCSDAPQDRAKPVRVQGGRLVVQIHGECSGNPSDPVGLYRTPSQQEGPAVVTMGNDLEFDAWCVTEGQFTRTDAAATYKGPFHTGSNLWLAGLVPGMPQETDVYVPLSNLGFPPLELGNFTLRHC